MAGCDGCGAQVRLDDRMCPICGAVLQAGGSGRPRIPIRRFGTPPPYPEEFDQMIEEDGPPMRRRGAGPRYGAYALALASALALVACAGYWLR
jgi:hypothetical protein